MAEREKRIPCDDCETEKQKIEDLPGHQYISCKEIEGEDGWCLFKWKTPID
jgi:hypothetical protein